MPVKNNSKTKFKSLDVTGIRWLPEVGFTAYKKDARVVPWRLPGLYI